MPHQGVKGRERAAGRAPPGGQNVTSTHSAPLWQHCSLRSIIIANMGDDINRQGRATSQLLHDFWGVAWACTLAAFLLVCLTAHMYSQEGNRPPTSYSYPDGKELIQRRLGPWDLSGGRAVYAGGVCVGFEGVMGPGKFFLPLRVKKTPAGPVFKRGRRIVTEFPAQVSVFIHAISGVRCSKQYPFQGNVTPPLQLLKSPHASADYIHHMKRHPLEITLAEEEAGPNTLLARGSRIWSYHFVVQAKGVHLADTVVVTLFLRDGTKAAQLTYRP